MNIFIIGCLGKMGDMIRSVAREKCDCVTGGIDYTANKDLNVVTDVSSVCADIDVIMDFSRPDALDKTIELTQKVKKPLIIATTGYSKTDLKRINDLSKTVPVFMSANLSVGVAVAQRMASMCHNALGDDFDVEIVEKHHNQKADCPSGTAYLLASAIADNQPTYARQGKRNGNEIGISSVRGGTVAGEHEVGFYGDNETVLITHIAQSRRIFAVGAVKSAHKLVKQPPALYTDLLTLLNS